MNEWVDGWNWWKRACAWANDRTPFSECWKMLQGCKIWQNVNQAPTQSYMRRREGKQGSRKCQKILGSTARTFLQVCPAQERVTRPVKMKLGAVNHRCRAGVVGVVGWGYADPTGCQPTTGKWMPEKAITMINLLRQFSNYPPSSLRLTLLQTHSDRHAVHTQ